MVAGGSLRGVAGIGLGVEINGITGLPSGDGKSPEVAGGTGERPLSARRKRQISYIRQTPAPDYDAILDGLHQRFSAHSEARSIPLDKASPAPATPPAKAYRLNDGLGNAVEIERPKPAYSFIPKATQVRSDMARAKAAAGEFTRPCSDPEGHSKPVSNGMQTNGQYRLKCTRCGQSRMASPTEAVELRAKQGRKGRSKNGPR